MKCYEEGHITMATVVDHIKPHRGDKKLFWDRGNWQPLCEHHHNVKTMTEDRYVMVLCQEKVQVKNDFFPIL